MSYRGGQQKTSLDFRVVLRAYLSDRAELWRSPSVANRWLFVMVARCLQQLRLVKRSPPSKTTDIFGGNLASVSVGDWTKNNVRANTIVSHCTSGSLFGLI